MTRRFLSSLLAVSLAVAACSGGDAEATETPRPSAASTTTTTLPPSTTSTTTVSVSIEGAPAGLSSLVEDFYDYAAGVTQSAPPAPEEVLGSVRVADVDVPGRGHASTGVFADTEVAVVEVGSDTFLAVDDGTGWRVVGGEWPSIGAPAFFGETPRFVAVVGSDARPGEDVDGSRADSIHFVGLDGSGRGAVVGLPRDSYVPVPGLGRRKVTTSLSLGGPDTMMATFADLTGLELEGYVMTGFSGFESLLGTVLGGLDIDIPVSINDRWAHVTLRSGEQVLNGAQALGFARARKTLPDGDFTRSAHQGLILLSAAKAVKAMGPASIPELMELSEPYLVTDLSAEQLLTFSAMAIAANLDEIPNIVAPGSAGSAGSASVVYLSSSADDLWADFADARLED